MVEESFQSELPHLAEGIKTILLRLTKMHQGEVDAVGGDVIQRQLAAASHDLSE